MEIRELDTCRTCLTTAGGMASIFQTRLNGSVPINDMLTSFCNVQLAAGDGYTERICADCSLETLKAYSFKLKCEESDVTLRSRAKLWEFNQKDDPIIFDVKKENTISEIKLEELSQQNLPSILEDDIKDEEFSNSEDNPMDADYEEEEVSLKRLRRANKKIGKCKKKKKLLMNYLSVKNVKDVKKEQFTDQGFKKIYECPKCHAIFQTFHMISKHLKKLHNTAVDTEKHFDSLVGDPKLSELNVELTDGSGRSLFKCTDCSFMSESFKKVKAHLIKHRGDKYIQCDECDYRCSLVAKLMKHKVVHTGERAHACAHCPYRASTGSILRTHAATQHSEERPYHCDRCTFTCKLKMNLAHHIMRTHDKVRTHACPHCGKTFFGSYQMKMHVLTHTGDKPQVCEHCGIRFTQKSNLQKHVALLHSAAPLPEHACLLCPYRGKTPHALRVHTKLHSGERPHKCDMCAFSSSSPGALRLHRRRHVGDARHVCATCGYRCYTANRLRAHERTHTGERPFPCDACNYRATTSQRLKNHKKSHENRKSYTCQYCPYRANYRSNLIKHLQKSCGTGQRRYCRNPDARNNPVEKISPQQNAHSHPESKTQEFKSNHQDGA